MDTLTEKEQIHQSAELCEEYEKVKYWRELNLETVQKQQESRKVSKKKYCNQHRISILAPIFISAAIFVLCSFIYMSIKGPTGGPTGTMIYVSTNQETLERMLIAILPFFPILIPVFRVCMRNSKFEDYWNKQCDKFIKDKEFSKQELRDTEEEYKELSRKVHDKSICIIPDKYIPVAYYINDLIINRRADTLKEAINVYENDLHNQIVQQQIKEHSDRMERELSYQSSLREWENDSITDQLKDINKKLGN